MFLGSKNFKKQYAGLFEEFENIYIVDEGDNAGSGFVKLICQCLSYGNLFTLNPKNIDPSCKDPSALHIKKLLDKDKLLETAEKITKSYYREVNPKNEEIPEHIEIANEILEQNYIKYYAGDYYIYNGTIYEENKSFLEKAIQNMSSHSTIYLQKEVLNFIRIETYLKEQEINPNYVVFKNGLFNIETHTFEEFTPEIFTTYMTNVNYISDDKLVEHKEMNYFLNSITCNIPERKERLATIYRILTYT